MHKQIYTYLMVYMLLAQKMVMASPNLAPRLLSFDDYVTEIYQRQNFTEEEDFESIRVALQEAYATPLDLNKINDDTLAGLGILYENQIKNYFNHLATTGPLYTVYELQAIPDFDLTTITLLLPFVYVLESYSIPSHSLWKRIAQSGHNYFLCHYAPSFSTTIPNHLNHLGNLNKCTVQLSLKDPNNIAWGITARKQAGESFCWDHATHRYGFNLWSIFMAVASQKYFKRMVIGDYQMGYGQGLLLSAGYIDKGNDIVSIIRSHNVGVRPYKGIRRIGLRGVAITSDLGAIALTGWYATNYLDATIELDGDNSPYTKGIDRTGRYRTTNQLKKKGTVHEQVVGCTIRKQHPKKQREVGINLLYNHYDTPIILKEDNVGHYLFRGASALATSLFYRLLWKNLILFGEGALTFPNATEKALMTGCIMSLSRYLDLSFALYYYGKGFYSPYGEPFKRYTTEHGNEKGVYGGVKLTPLASWQIATSGHFFATLRPKPQLALASSGYRLTTRSSYALNRATVWVIQHKLDKNPKNKSNQEEDRADEAKMEIASKNSLKLKIDHKLTHYWWTHAEVQYTRHTFLGQTHHGYALSNTEKWKGKRFQFSCKIIYFHTKDYATRLYFYAPSPLYNGTLFRPHYGNGIATTWLVVWKPIRWIRLELKYVFTHLFKELLRTKKTKKHRATPAQDKHEGALQLLLNF